VLHIGGERIEFVDELPEISPELAPLQLEATLGDRVSLEEARRAAGFDPRELDEAPDRVYLGPRGTIWFLYGDLDSIRLLVAQTRRLSIDETFILKKVVGEGTRVEQVSVAGQQGYFLTGEPHAVLMIDQNGGIVEESARLARDVLIWEDDGVAFRLEGDFAKDEALEIAEALR
jgi:hypothetical protein